MVAVAQRQHFISPRKRPEARGAIPSESRVSLWTYLIGIAQNLKVVPIAVGGTSNHAHVLLRVPPGMPLAEVVQS